MIGQLGASATLTKIRNHSLNLYKELENETGLSTGLKQNGSLTVATTKERLDELKRQVTTAQLFNVDAYEVSNQMASQGLFVGQSSGAYILGAKMIAEESKNGHIVTIFNDIGERYFSTSMWG